MKYIFVITLLVSISFGSEKTSDGFPNYTDEKCLIMNRLLVKMSKYLDTLEPKYMKPTLTEMLSESKYLEEHCYDDPNMDEDNLEYLKKGKRMTEENLSLWQKIYDKKAR